MEKSNDISIVDIKPSFEYPDRHVYGDVRSKYTLSQSVPAATTVINLAAEHRDDVHPLNKYYETNEQGASNVCDVAREKQIEKIIFTSSVAVYGLSAAESDENALLNPTTDYGKSKVAAEQVYEKWQSEDPFNRTLVIIRPTVVFGVGNRGNVYNLIARIVSGKYLMIGRGDNKKSMAYVENLSKFISQSASLGPGVHIFNYIDKPDLTMSELITLINATLGRVSNVRFYIPYFLGIFIGKIFDLFAFITRRSTAISSIRIKKFCSRSVFKTKIDPEYFTPPVSLEDGLRKTVKAIATEANITSV